MTVKNITVLGATGSIGAATLEVAALHPDRFSIFALTAHRQVERLAELCLRFKPRYAVVADETAARSLHSHLQAAGVETEVLSGERALCEVSSDAGTDVVMAAIVGAAGLVPTMAAAKAGKTICLANKETLVVAGSLFLQAVRDGGATLLPVDSEHNAIFQSLPEGYDGNMGNAGVDSLILTASGGPFLNTPAADLAAVTPMQAVRHPNWEMGQKISVDSADMMNKGLELIEAHHLFNVPAAKLEVVIHPESVIHSMVRYRDGSVVAQLGVSDMRIPIACCLGYPERIVSGVPALDFTRLSGLHFAKPDLVRFPCLKLAYDVLHSGSSAAACVLNAANEVAVAAFLAKHLGFADIPRLIGDCLQRWGGAEAVDVESLLALDAQVRASAHVWARNHRRILPN